MILCLIYFNICFSLSNLCFLQFLYFFVVVSLWRENFFYALYNLFLISLLLRKDAWSSLGILNIAFTQRNHSSNWSNLWFLLQNAKRWIPVSLKKQLFVWETQNRIPIKLILKGITFDEEFWILVRLQLLSSFISISISI